MRAGEAGGLDLSVVAMRRAVCNTTSMAQSPGVVLRAALTNDELAALRKCAIDEGRRVSELVAEALRAYWDIDGGPLTPKEQSE